MAEDAGGTSGGIGKSISFVAETISKTAADVAGTVWNHLTQTQFTVDIDQAPKLVESLTQAVEKLDDAYQKSAVLRTVQTPGKDPYSGFTTLAIRQSAGDDEGGYGWANREARKALVKTIENLKKSIEEYGRTDQAARDALKKQ
jgi:hypothetical protein